MTKVNRTFDIEIAKEFDTDTAIILHNIHFWIDLNQKNNENFIDGKYWTYNSAGKFTEVFEWLSEKQIRTRLNKLIKAGYLEEGNFNKRGGDKTKWYSLTNQSDQMVTCTDQMVTCSSQMVSDTDQMVTATSQMVTPLPDINTDIKPDINTDERERVKNILEDLPFGKELKKDTPYSSQDFLLSLNEETILEFLENFNCSRTQIIKKAQDLYDWCETNGKRKKNHKSFLRSALRKDYGDKQKLLKPEDDLEEFIRRLNIINEIKLNEANERKLPKNEL